MENKTRIIPILALLLVISGCCQFSYEDKDYLLDAYELSFFDAYHTGETIYFEDASGDLDTIQIVEISPNNTDPSCACGKGSFMNPRPENTRSISIKHLPADKWIGKTEEHLSNGEVKITEDPQILFSITKFPVEKEMESQIAFKNFRSTLSINLMNKKAIELNGKTWTNYFSAENTFLEAEKDSLSIHKIYWTVEEGLIGYETKNGKIYTRK